MPTAAAGRLLIAGGEELGRAVARAWAARGPRLSFAGRAKPYITVAYDFFTGGAAAPPFAALCAHAAAAIARAAPRVVYVGKASVHEHRRRGAPRAAPYPSPFALGRPSTWHASSYDRPMESCEQFIGLQNGPHLIVVLWAANSQHAVFAAEDAVISSLRGAGHRIRNGPIYSAGGFADTRPEKQGRPAGFFVYAALGGVGL